MSPTSLIQTSVRTENSAVDACSKRPLNGSLGTTSGRIQASTTGARLFGTFAIVQRQCSRPGCAEPAVVTLTYQYAGSAVWLDDLSPERDPHAYDLCRRHGERLSVPTGWRMDDRRSSREFVFAATG